MKYILVSSQVLILILMISNVNSCVSSPKTEGPTISDIIEYRSTTLGMVVNYPKEWSLFESGESILIAKQYELIVGTNDLYGAGEFMLTLSMIENNQLMQFIYRLQNLLALAPPSSNDLLITYPYTSFSKLSQEVGSQEVESIAVLFQDLLLEQFSTDYILLSTSDNNSAQNFNNVIIMGDKHRTTTSVDSSDSNVPALKQYIFFHILTDNILTVATMKYANPISEADLVDILHIVNTLHIDDIVYNN